jgi:hypothetical protein
MTKIKQITGNIHFGRAKVVFSRIGAYFGYINFLIILITFYSVKGHEYAPLWLYFIITVIGLICLGLLDYLIMMPCEIAFSNEQFVKHQNPVYDEIKEIKEILNKQQ